MARTPAPCLTFHGLFPSPSLEAEVRGEMDDIPRRCDGILGCRVLVELPDRHQRRGGFYRLVVEITAADGRIVVGRSPDEAAMRANARVALRAAFLAVRRTLDEASPS